MRAFDAADRILTALEKHPGGLNMRMLLYTTGLTPGQYRAGYNWTFDTLGEAIWVKARIDKEWVYILPENYEQASEDWYRTIRTQITRARREHSKIHAIAGKHPTLDMRLSEIEAQARLDRLQIEKERIT